MNLFDTVKGDIFSVLASPKKRLYAEALDVLWEVYQDHLKIPEQTYFNQLYQRLEKLLEEIDFEEEDMEKEERESVQGKTRYIIRLLIKKGWIEKETGADLKYVLSVPGCNGTLLEVFQQLGKEQSQRGFSYVYGTYSALKIADHEGTPMEKKEAVFQAFHSTQELLSLLKNVYHSIKGYFNLQAETMLLNDVLAIHYDDFAEKVLERHIRPLKIKDSIPKYRDPIQGILTRWLEDGELLNAMSQAYFQDSPEQSLADCQKDLQKKMFWIKEQYNTLEHELMDEIDNQYQRYNRAFTQKIENSVNRDRNMKGNLIFLLEALSKHTDEHTIVPRISENFNLFQQNTIHSESLYKEKAESQRKISEPLKIQKKSVSKEAMSDIANLVSQRYGSAQVFAFMRTLMGEKEWISTQDFPFQQEEGYLMCILAVHYANERNSFYDIRHLDGRYETTEYTLPQLQFYRKKEEKTL